MTLNHVLLGENLALSYDSITPKTEWSFWKYWIPIPDEARGEAFTIHLCMEKVGEVLEARVLVIYSCETSLLHEGDRRDGGWGWEEVT